MKVIFIYQAEGKSLQREAVAIKLCEAVSKIIVLPENIEIEFALLNPSVYGETIINSRFKNRVRLNNTLTAKEIIPALVHELIHLNQTHTGLLSMTRDGRYIWKNKIYKTPHVGQLTFNEHSQLPWEIDVAQKQQKILNEAIQLALTLNG
jgi:predicted metallopeptidase